MKKTKTLATVNHEAVSIINSIYNLITKLEQIRDFERDLNSDEIQFLNLLYVIHDFIAKSELMNNNPDNYKIISEFMIDIDNEGMRGKTVYKYFTQDFKFVDEILKKLKGVNV